MSVEGKIALVTGAGGGLGKAYAEYLAAHGATVIVNNRIHPDRPSKARSVAEAIVSAGGKAIADENDVASEAGCRAMMQRAYEKYGRLDILVCNAGTEQIQKLRELNLDDFRKQMDVHLYGQLIPLSVAFPRMLEAGYGRVVLTTSAAGVFTSRNRVAYSVAKAAVIGLTRAAAAEAKSSRKDVRVNSISPYARTGMSAGIIPQHMDEIMPPEKVAPVVGWLCSQACQVNGEVLAAGAGRVRRQLMVEGPRLDIGDGDLSALWSGLADGGHFEERADATASSFALIPELLERRD